MTAAQTVEQLRMEHVRNLEAQIAELTRKNTDLASEAAMLRKYETEICAVLRESERVAVNAHQKLASVANALGYKPYGEIAKGIDTYLTEAKRQAKLFENSSPSFPDTDMDGVTTMVFVPKAVRKIECPCCYGRGAVMIRDPDPEDIVCPTCKGEKTVEVDLQDGQKLQCPRCFGQGKVMIRDPEPEDCVCPTCKGAKYVQ
jgi:hypothetical protein